MELTTTQTQHGQSQADLNEYSGNGEFYQRIGMTLIWLSICWTVFILYIHEATLHMAHPQWLIPATLWMAWPHRRPTLHHLQMLVYLYLIFLTLLAALPVYWDIGLITNGAISLRISQTAGILLLAATGLVFHRRTEKGNNNTSEAFRKGLLIAFAVLAVHALILVLLLRWAYGYGWMEDLPVAGRLGLCLLALFIAGPLGKSHWFRGLIGIPLVLLFWMAGQ